MRLQTVTVLQMWGANVSLDVLDAVRGEHHAFLELIFRQHWSPYCVAARRSGSFNTTLWAASHKRLNVAFSGGMCVGRVRQCCRLQHVLEPQLKLV